MQRDLFRRIGITAVASLTVATVALPTSASAYDPSNLVDPANPASPISPLNPNSPNYPFKPAAQPAGFDYGYGYGYGYGAANPTIVGLSFWTGRPYTEWACQLGVDFQCPSSPNYAYRRSAPTAYDPADTVPPAKIRRKHRNRY